MLVTVWAISVANILYLLTLALGNNIQKMSNNENQSISKRCHQDLNSVANILKLSPAVSQQHHSVTNMTIAIYDKWFITNGWGYWAMNPQRLGPTRRAGSDEQLAIDSACFKSLNVIILDKSSINFVH